MTQIFQLDLNKFGHQIFSRFNLKYGAINKVPEQLYNDSEVDFAIIAKSKYGQFCSFLAVFRFSIHISTNIKGSGGLHQDFIENIENIGPGFLMIFWGQKFSKSNKIGQKA